MTDSTDAAETAGDGAAAPHVGWRTVVARGVVALALALLANGALLLVVQAGDLVEPFGALTAPPVLTLTAGAAVGATAVYWIVGRLTTAANASFTALAALLLALSALPTIGLLLVDPDATAGAVVVLLTMHVTVAASCVAVLTGWLALPFGDASSP